MVVDDVGSAEVLAGPERLILCRLSVLSVACCSVALVAVVTKGWLLLLFSSNQHQPNTLN